MDAAKLISTDPVSLPQPPGQSTALSGATEEKMKRAAMDFESVLIGKLLEAMKNTIGQFSGEKDAVSSQLRGIFWLYLARDIADNGGFGMWKQIYQSLSGPERTGGPAESMDKTV